MAASSDGVGRPARPCRVFISYAMDEADPGHARLVLRLWEFLRSCGIDARLDRPAEVQRKDWTQWMADEIRDADRILIIASPAYRERAEGRSDPAEGRGVQWEARLIRNAFYADQQALNRFVPVVLPGYRIEDVPDFLAPHMSTVYRVSDFTVADADALLRFLTGQPEIIEPPLGPIPVLGPASASPAAPATSGGPMPPSDIPITTRSGGPRRIRRVHVRTMIFAAVGAVTVVVAIVVSILLSGGGGSAPPPTTVAETLHYTASCSGVHVWGTWPYHDGANQLDVSVNGGVIGSATITTADEYDSVIHPNTGVCQWRDINSGTAIGLLAGTGQNTIMVRSISCPDNSDCSGSKTGTFPT